MSGPQVSQPIQLDHSASPLQVGARRPVVAAGEAHLGQVADLCVRQPISVDR